MQRWDIINKFISDRKYRDYLEIGYYKGWSFDNVNAPYDIKKVAVDPNPCKTEEQEKVEYGKDIFINGELHLICKKTSDDFFKHAKSWNAKFSIIFIDGLHEYSQVYKDIHNAIDCLESNGVIILHDLNPPKYEHTTTGIDGCWTGDTYKAFLKFQEEDHFGRYICYTIDTDWGVGVIEKANVELERPITDKYQKAIDSWECFDQNRKELLNLISVEEFLKRFQK